MERSQLQQKIIDMIFEEKLTVEKCAMIIKYAMSNLSGNSVVMRSVDALKASSTEDGAELIGASLRDYSTNSGGGVQRAFFIKYTTNVAGDFHEYGVYVGIRYVWESDMYAFISLDDRYAELVEIPGVVPELVHEKYLITGRYVDRLGDIIDPLSKACCIEAVRASAGVFGISPNLVVDCDSLHIESITGANHCRILSLVVGNNPITRTFFLVIYTDGGYRVMHLVTADYTSIDVENIQQNVLNTSAS